MLFPKNELNGQSPADKLGQLARKTAPAQKNRRTAGAWRAETISDGGEVPEPGVARVRRAPGARIEPALLFLTPPRTLR